MAPVTRPDRFAGWVIATAAVTPTAQDDLQKIAAHIAADNPDAAHRFLTAARQLFDLIAGYPLLGMAYPHPKHVGLRVRTISKRFRNYVVFYRVSDRGVEIIRVLHGAQDVARVLDRE